MGRPLSARRGLGGDVLTTAPRRPAQINLMYQHFYHKVDHPVREGSLRRTRPAHSLLALVAVCVRASPDATPCGGRRPSGRSATGGSCGTSSSTSP